MLKCDDNLCNVYPDLVLLELLPLVEVGEQLPSAHVI